MRFGVRRLVACLLCCGVGLAVSPVVALGEGSPPGEGSAAPAPFEGPLTVPGVLGSEVEQAQAAEEAKRAAEEAKRSSPEAVSLREESRTKFENLNTEQAGKIAGEAFPEVVNSPAGGPPRLSAGQKIVGFASDSIAQVDLGGGKHGVIEATQPMAVQTSSGQRTPIDLSLNQVGNVFEPATPAVGVLIPRRLSDGVQLPALNLSLTPVDAQGSPLAGSEGALTGASVLYANTQTDSDTLVKPTTGGFEADTLLRSVASPGQLYFRVGLPEGASLVQSPSGAGLVKVMVEGSAVAMIRPPSASDAAGASVAVSMSVNGDLLALTVASHSGEYQWPISVDPQLESVTDSTISETSNWGIHAEQESKFKHFWTSNTVEQYNLGSNNPAEYTQAQYYTQGESKIYKVEAESAGTVSKGRAKLQLVHEGGVEQTATIAQNTSWGSTITPLCANAECSAAGGGKGNAAWFRLEATEPATETYSVSGALWNTHVYIAQEKAPEPTFNETEVTIDGGRTNVLYGTEHATGRGPWLGPNTGAFEVKAHDPGIGVSWAQTVIQNWIERVPIFGAGKCKGVQCNQNYAATFTYNPSMPDGEHTIEEDATNLAGNWLLNGEEIGLLGKATQLVKIDSTRPHGLEVSGWSKSREISAAPHTLTFAATDGTSPTNSSGVKAISVSVDGGPESSVPVVPCTLGPCTVSGTWTLNAESLTEGAHRLVETATDNADNVASEEFTFDVRHGSPVSVGPGAVDPTTGQFKLGATDVSLAGAGAVSRVYQSRNLVAGAEGPLGPQWAISLGGGEGLTVLPNGNVVLAGSAAGRTTFTRNAKGEFEAPIGDSNLKIEAKEKEKGKGITEYLLVDATAGTSTRFTQPNGTQSTTPTYASQFGAEGAQLKGPVSDALDSSGNVWVTDSQNNRIEKFSPTGTLLAAYGSYGSGNGQFSGPWGIAVNQSTGNVYVTDQANFRVEELSSTGSFVRSFGSQGSGNGQFSTLAGVAVDSSGNVWVADFGNNRIQEFNEKGEYIQKFGSEGSGNGQFKNPVNMTFSGGNLYVSDYGNNRVEEFSTSGTYIAQFGGAGSGNGQFLNPYGIATDPSSGNLYVVDNGHTRVEEFSSAGAFITKFGSSGTGVGQFASPTGVAVNSSGGVYVEDYSANRVEEWTRPSWLPTLAEGPLKSGTTTYAYGAVEVEGKTVIEPTEALAPAPSGVSCGTKPEELKEAGKKGCRGLTFNYAETTTARGENSTEWGDYKGQLTRVYLHAWDPSKGAMAEPIVAQYEYDSKGRLRAEWDPRISPALKTTYGYDAEGHVTALTPPGQESWAFTYGTVVGDANAGRLLKVTRAPASAPLWSGAPPTSEEEPKLSGTQAVGTTLGVSTGKWTGNPVAYSYQWEDCNEKGEACVPIVGADNANYTLVAHDGGHRVAVVVSAINGGGSAAIRVKTNAISGDLESSQYSLESSSKPYAVAAGSDGNLYVTVPNLAGITAVTTSGSVTKHLQLPGPSEPKGIAPGAPGTLWVAEHGTSKIAKVTITGGFYDSEYALPSGSTPLAIVNGPDGNAWFTEQGTGKIGKITPSGAITQYSLPSGQTPMEIAAGSDGNLWYTVPNKNVIGKITTAGAITEYSLPSGSEPHGLAAGPKGTIWVTEYGTSKITKFTTYGKEGEYSLPSGSQPWAITEGPDGSMWFTDTGTHELGRITASGTIAEFNVASASYSYSIVKGPDGKLWFPYPATGKLVKMTLPSNAEHHLPEAGSTIEYRVPVSGGAAPYGLGATEAKSWGQEDDPVEGVAIFPPDEPQGWPASSYKRATIRYLDSEGRLVNTATSPGDAIATTEYNETNDVVRTLSADNRATAQKEGSKSAEVSKTLDTQSTYSAEGTQLEGTLGPEHEVKLASGAEVKARAHVKYFYDEGAPAEYAHDGLVTKTTNGAQYSGKEEDVRTTTTSFSGQENLGWKLRKPTSVTTDPSGLKLMSTTVYEPVTGNVLEAKTPAAAGGDATVPSAYSLAFGATGSAGGQFEGPEHDAVDGSGNVWVTDYANHRIQKLSPSGGFLLAVGWGVKDGKAEAETCTASCRAGISGSGNGQFEGPFGIAVNQSSGNVYVADYLSNRIEELSSAGAFVASFGSKGTGGGQFSSPEGVSIDSSGNVWVSDSANNRIQELSSTGTFTLAVGWGVKDSKAEAETCTASCQVGVAGSGNGQLSSPTGVAFAGSNLYVSDYGNNRVDEFSSAGVFVSKFGTQGSGSGQFEGPFDIAAESTSGDLYVVDGGNDRVQKFTAAGTFVATFGSKGSGNGQLLLPAGVAVTSSGGVYVSDHNNNRIEKWVPAITGSASAHDIKTIYYTGAANSEYPACGGHVEWENLVCETKPVAQPGSPELPVITVTYNVLDEAEATTETFGSTTRTKIQTYDVAGRALTSEETSTVDTALPKLTNKYSTTTGVVEAQSTTVGETTRTIKSEDNTLGQMTSYTDADGNTTTYEYEQGKDARLTKMSYMIGPEGFSQKFGYNETTGAMQEVVDSAAGSDPSVGKFTATYDVEGNMLTERYPNGMTATYTLNPLGQATGLEYVKTTHCTEKCTWFSDSVTPSIHGETLVHTSTLAKDSYAYDKAGRLTEAQETPTGKGCATRLYGYDEEANRTTLTQRGSSTETCATEGGSTEWHTYDTANRPTDAGIVYETFGNATKLPASDAGEHEITSSYYVDGQVASQTQNGETVNDYYDPAGRTRETVSTGKTASTVISHYSGSGEALTWTSEGSEKWTRNIPGIDGALDAIQTNAGTPVLQVHDLKGDIVATAALSETETKLLSTYNSTEFGVPQPGTTPPKYAWLGAGGVASEPSFGTGTVTQGGASYVPQLARSLQTAPVVPPGAFPNGTGTGSTYTSVIPGWSTAVSNEESASTLAEYAAKLEAARKKAEQEAAETAERIHGEEEAWPTPTEGGAEEPEIDDPSILLTSRQSFVLAAGLRNGGAALEAATARIPAAALFIKLVVTLSGHIATELAEGLEGCYKLINELNANARCKPFIDLLVVVPVGWGVDTCFAQEHRSRKGKVNYSYPYCDKVGDE